MEFAGGKRHFPLNQGGAKTREGEIAERGFQREEGGAFVVEPTEDLKGDGTHMDKPLVTELSDPKIEEPLQTGGQFVGDRDAEIAHRGFDRKAGGAFQDEPKDDLHGKGTHMDKPLVTELSDPKRDEPLQEETFAKDREGAIAERGFVRKEGGAFKEEPRGDLKGEGTHLDKPLVNDKDIREEPIQTGSEFIGDREAEIAHRGFDRKAGGEFKDEPRDDLQGKGTHMDKPLVTGTSERKEGFAQQKELQTKASKHVEEKMNPGEKIRERFERTAEKSLEAQIDKPLVYGYGNKAEGDLKKEDLIKASEDNNEKINPGEKIRERFDRTVEKVEEARLEGKKEDLKEFVTKASKHVEEKINPGEKIRERFDRTLDKVDAAEQWVDKPLVTGYGNLLPEEPLHKEDLIKVSHDNKEEINPGEKIRDRFERTLEKVDEAEKAKLAQKILIDKQNLDAGLKEEEIKHYLDKKEQSLS